MRKLTHLEIVERQQEQITQAPRLPVTIILNNIRSLHNVGSIFRTADGAGVEKIILCGITGYPPHSQITKTALGAEMRVPWEFRRDILSVIKELRAKNYKIVLLEQMEGSISYDEFFPTFPLALVIGNEIEGVSDQLVSHCDAAIEIEMAGEKNSLNVSVAAGIVMYYLRNAYKAILWT